METRELAGRQVTVVGLGCNNLGTRCDEDASTRVVQAALDAGITIFDTADSYGNGRSEELLGKALGSRRDEVIIATKFRPPMADAADLPKGAPWVAESVEASLRRLGTDRIDLYQQHFPHPGAPIDETLEELHKLVRDGKVLAIGNSNFSGEQTDEAATVAAEKKLTPFTCAQNEYSLLRRRAEGDVLAACQRHGLAFLPYFPLASGMLTGKYRRGEEPPEGTRLAGVPAERRDQMMRDKYFDVVEQLEAFAAKREHSVLELAFSWLVAQPVVTSVIAGATRPEQVHANVLAAGWKLADDELEEIDRITAVCK